jgi:hypothetical protein
MKVWTLGLNSTGIFMTWTIFLCTDRPTVDFS